MSNDDRMAVINMSTKIAEKTAPAKVSKYVLRESKGDSFLEHLLHSRGIVTPEDKQAFLAPSYESGTHDPFLLKDMQKVVDRIVAAVANNERIAIYSDFDADGIPGAVVLHDFFKKIGYTNTFHYIPHRHREGFGVHVAAIEDIAKGKTTDDDENFDTDKNGGKKSGAKLVITIDCGIGDVETAKRAKELGMDFIVTDHHTPDKELPDAFAIVNPKQPGCEYPEKMLCGSGVIFKVVQALCKTEPFKEKVSEGWEKWLLDMVGIATLSDMVPLRGENRVFAYYGLLVLRKTPRLGLVKLFKNLKVQQRHLTEEDIAFLITPRINAASRMADPKDAFLLLSTTDDSEADKKVLHLNTINDERKVKVALLVKDIKKKIEERGLHAKNGQDGYKPVIVLGSPDWKPPVLGLAATNIIREHNKPILLWGKSDEGVIKGSCRAPDGFDIVSVMRQVPQEIFINVGGHVAAGGFAVAEGEIHRLEEEILKAFEGMYGGKTGDKNCSVSEVVIDKVLEPGEVGRYLWSDIEKMSPFGEGNPKPVFVLKGVTVSSLKLFGKKKEHVEVVILNDENGHTTKAIKFFGTDDSAMMEKLEKSMQNNMGTDIIATMEKSMFRNFPEFRIRILEVL